MKQFQKHVFCCSGEDCAERGADSKHYDMLRDAVEKQTPRGTVKVTQSGCMGACGFGPNIAIYPEGVWYYGVKTEDIQEIVAEHVVGGRIVSRLLFHKHGEPLADEVVRDRVCGMVFRVSEAKARLVHNGAPQYFCGEHCRAAFQADPAAFMFKGHSSHVQKGP